MEPAKAAFPSLSSAVRQSVSRSFISFHAPPIPADSVKMASFSFRLRLCLLPKRGAESPGRKPGDESAACKARLFRLFLILNIFLDRFDRCTVSDRNQTIAGRPKLVTPKLVSDTISKVSSHISAADRLQPPDEIRGTYRNSQVQKKMDMIRFSGKLDQAAS